MASPRVRALRRQRKPEAVHVTERAITNWGLQVLGGGNSESGETQNEEHKKHEKKGEEMFFPENVDGPCPQLDADIDSKGDDKDSKGDDVGEEIFGLHDAERGHGVGHDDAGEDAAAKFGELILATRHRGV